MRQTTRLALVSIPFLLSAVRCTPYEQGDDSASSASSIEAFSVFGKQTIGSPFTTATADYKRASRYSLAQSAATVTKVSAYLDGRGTTTGTQTVRAVVYADVNGSPDALLCASSDVTIVAGAAGAWIDFAVQGCSLNAGAYWLGLQTGASTGVARYYADAVAGALRMNADAFTDGATNPFGATSSGDAQLSINATFTTAAGGTFGNQSPGAPWVVGGGDYKRGSLFTLAASGANVTKLSAYLDGSGAASGSEPIRGVIYADSAGAPGARRCVTADVVVAAGRPAGWVDLPLAGCTLGAGGYWLVLHTGPGGIVRYYGDAAPMGTLVHAGDVFADGASDPFGAAATDALRIAMYATYATGGCVPKACAALGFDCGATGDGCGGTLQCGACASPATCSGGGTANVCGAPPTGPSWYVSPSGSDANAGTQAAPFRHLSKGAAIAKAGDTVVALDGTYDNEGVVAPGYVVKLQTSGAPGKPITFRAQNRGKAILDAMNTSTGTSCNGAAAYFDLFHASYIAIRGFVIQRGCDEGIHSNDDAHHVTIAANEIRSIANRTVTDQIGRDGIFLNASEHDFTFDGNVFHDIGRTDGISPMHFDHGIYAHATNVVIVNNVFYRMTKGWPIQLADGASAWTVANNTFVGAGPSGEEGQIMFWGTNTGIAVENNIFDGPLGHAMTRYAATVSASPVDHNLVFGAAAMLADATGFSVGTNLLGVDPKLVAPDAPTYDFRLMPTSPAIDAASNVPAVTTDLSGLVRPFGPAPDLGAFEWRP